MYLLPLLLLTETKLISDVLIDEELNWLFDSDEIVVSTISLDVSENPYILVPSILEVSLIDLVVVSS